MSDNENSLFNQSLEKGLAVLRAFNARNRTMNLAEVAEAADITKSSAQRMIHTLEALGYVSKHPQTKRFQLTPQVMEIGYNYLAADTLVDVANPFLAELAQTTGETTNLTEPVRTTCSTWRASWGRSSSRSTCPSAAASPCTAPLRAAHSSVR